MLLEQGNAVDMVAKCLNHSSAAVTQAFYLKETAAQVAARASIPWLNKKDTKPELPAFLKCREGENASERKRRKITSQSATLKKLGF